MNTNLLIECECGCGQKIEQYDKWGRRRRRVNGHGNARPLKERFLEKIKIINNCWIWIGAKNSDGYGQIGKGNKLLSCHRVAWEIYHGSIPIDKQVLHKCDTPPCVNPDHLFLGTNLDNIEDAIKKGRISANLLSNSEILKIRSWYKSKVYSLKELADIFNVTNYYITRIVRFQRRVNTN